MNNLVVQLLLKTGTFSTDLKQAKGQVQNFQKGCQTAGKSVSGFTQALGLNVGSLVKFGGAVGTAVLAGKEFKAILESTQTTGDAFQNTLAGCKGVIDGFNRSLATGDFSNFSSGLWSIYDAAKAARQALDDLQDAYAFYGLLSSESRTKFMTAQEQFRNPESTQTQKEQSLNVAQEAIDEQYEYLDGLQQKTLDNFKKQIQKWAGEQNISLNDISFDQLREVGKEFLKDSEAATNKYKTGYDKLLNDRNEYRVSWWDKQDKHPFAPTEYNNITAVNKLTRSKADIVVGRAILEMNDDDRNALIQSVQSIDQATQAVKANELALDRMKKSLISGSTGSGSGGSKLKEEIPIQEESLAYWQKLAAEAKKHRDAEVFNSEEWNKYNSVLGEALGKIEEINLKEKVMAKRKEMEANPLTPITPITAQAEILPKDVKKTANELALEKDIFEKLLKDLKEGDPLIEKYKAHITDIQKRLEQFKVVTPKAPEVKKETIDTWESFNQAMANTSTIVSSLTSTFSDSAEITAASILQMVSAALPAIGSLISAISALTATEAVEAGTAAVGKAVSSSKHWIEAIAAVASLGAVVAAAISAAKKPATQRFANGGIVGGSSFTGDRVSAQVNSGEMILNKSQQARLFQMANGGGEGRQVEFHISGTDLVGVLNNNTRKSRITR